MWVGSFGVAQEAPGSAPQRAQAADPALPDLAAQVKRATTLLVECQETLDQQSTRDEWPYEGVYREGRDIPLGYRIGGTSIVAWALIESPHYERSDEARAAVARGVAFVLEHLEHSKMSIGFDASYDVRSWGPPMR